MDDAENITLTLEHFIVGIDKVRIVLTVAQDKSHTPIAEDMLQLLMQKSVCERCTQPPENLHEHFLCAPNNRFPDRLFFAIDKMHLEEARSINTLHHQRRRRLERLTRILEAGGSHTKVEVRQQYYQQGGHCFYCYKELRTPEGAYDAHADHYIPVSNGGSNDIANIVVACSACNLQKSSSAGESFRIRKYGEAPPEVKALLRRIQRRKKF